MYRIFSKKLIALLVVLLAADISAAPYLGWGAARPSFLFLALCFFAFESGWHAVLPLALVTGLLRDVTGGPMPGLETFILAALVYLLDRSGRNVTSSSVTVRMGAAFLFIAAVNLIGLAALSIFGRFVTFSFFNISLCLKAALLNALFYPLLHYFAKRVFSRRKRFHQYELFR